MVAPKGSRLSREQRREQLVALGVELVAASSFDAVSIDDVAAAAGISRSLLFHYFPTKRDFQVAVARAGAEELLSATEPDPGLAPPERLRASLEAFVDYVAQRRAAFLSLVRGAGGGDPALAEVFDRVHGVVAGRVIDGLGVDEASATPLLRVAVRGWVAFTEEAVVVWLAEGSPGRDEVVALLEATLVAAVTAAAGPRLVEDWLAAGLGRA